MIEQTHPRHDTAEQHEQVLLGVDTHKDVHVAAVITSTGVLLGIRGFPTTREGYLQLLSWARTFGQLQLAGVECTRSYGAALTRYLHHEGITVTDVNQPDKAARRRHGKSDDIDAAVAARAVLSGRATATAKTTDGRSRRSDCSRWPRPPRSSPVPWPSTSSKPSSWRQSRHCVSPWPDSVTPSSSGAVRS
ncbi:IS110 family transposase [Streptomyces europaeiscabiei]|uniref:IS110 family transposase n=1 Tax=Streptomyces europaeiscabiei TaxID=146819 RepID=UPI002E18DF3E